MVAEEDCLWVEELALLEEKLLAVVSELDAGTKPASLWPENEAEIWEEGRPWEAADLDAPGEEPPSTRGQAEMWEGGYVQAEQEAHDLW